MDPFSNVRWTRSHKVSSSYASGLASLYSNDEDQKKAQAILADMQSSPNSNVQNPDGSTSKKSPSFLDYLNPIGEFGLFGQRNTAQVARTAEQGGDWVRNKVDEFLGEKGNDEFDSAKDVARFTLNLVPGMVEGFLQSGKNFNEAATGERVTFDEQGNMEDEREKLNTTQRVAAGVVGTLDSAGMLAGGSGKFIKEVFKKPLDNAVKSATKTTADRVVEGATRSVRNSLVEGAEESVQSVAQDLQDDSRLSEDWVSNAGKGFLLGTAAGGIFDVSGRAIGATKNAAKTARVNRSTGTDAETRQSIAKRIDEASDLDQEQKTAYANTLTEIGQTVNAIKDKDSRKAEFESRAAEALEAVKSQPKTAAPTYNVDPVRAERMVAIDKKLNQRLATIEREMDALRENNDPSVKRVIANDGTDVTAVAQSYDNQVRGLETQIRDLQSQAEGIDNNTGKADIPDQATSSVAEPEFESDNPIAKQYSTLHRVDREGGSPNEEGLDQWGPNRGTGGWGSGLYVNLAEQEIRGGTPDAVRSQFKNTVENPVVLDTLGKSEALNKFGQYLQASSNNAEYLSELPALARKAGIKYDEALARKVASDKKNELGDRDAGISDKTLKEVDQAINDYLKAIGHDSVINTAVDNSSAGSVILRGTPAYDRMMKSRDGQSETNADPSEYTGDVEGRAKAAEKIPELRQKIEDLRAEQAEKFEMLGGVQTVIDTQAVRAKVKELRREKAEALDWKIRNNLAETPESLQQKKKEIQEGVVSDEFVRVREPVETIEAAVAMAKESDHNDVSQIQRAAVVNQIHREAAERKIADLWTAEKAAEYEAKLDEETKMQEEQINQYPLTKKQEELDMLYADYEAKRQANRARVDEDADELEAAQRALEIVDDIDRRIVERANSILESDPMAFGKVDPEEMIEIESGIDVALTLKKVEYKPEDITPIESEGAVTQAIRNTADVEEASVIIDEDPRLSDQAATVIADQIGTGNLKGQIWDTFFITTRDALSKLDNGDKIITELDGALRDMAISDDTMKVRARMDKWKLSYKNKEVSDQSIAFWDEGKPLTRLKGESESRFNERQKAVQSIREYFDDAAKRRGLISNEEADARIAQLESQRDDAVLRRANDETESVDNSPVTSKDIETVISDYRRRFGDRGTIDISDAGDGNRGSYRRYTDETRIDSSDSDIAGTASHEAVHKAIARHLEDSEIKQLYKDIVKFRGGKSKITKYYRESGYDGISWQGAAEEELGNVFAEFYNTGRADIKSGREFDPWQIAKKMGIPDSMADILLKLAIKVDGIFKPSREAASQRVVKFFERIESGEFAAGPVRDEPFIAPESISKKIKSVPGRIVDGLLDGLPESSQVSRRAKDPVSEIDAQIEEINSKRMVNNYFAHIHTDMGIDVESAAEALARLESGVNDKGNKLTQKQRQMLERKVAGLDIGTRQIIAKRGIYKVGKDGHAIKRQGADGWSRDIPFVLEMYQRSTNRALYMQPAIDNIRKMTADADLGDRQINFIEQTLNSVTGKKSGVDQVMGDRVNSVLRTTRRFSNMALMGASARTVILQPTAILNNWRLDSEQGGGTKQFIASTIKAIGAANVPLTKSPAVREFLEAGGMEGSWAVSLKTDRSSKMESVLFSGIALMDRNLRFAAYDMGKQTYLKKNAKDPKNPTDVEYDAAKRAGIAAAKEAQFGLGPLDVPLAQNNEVGKAIFQLQQFNMKQLGREADFLIGKEGVFRKNGWIDPKTGKLNAKGAKNLLKTVAGYGAIYALYTQMSVGGDEDSKNPFGLAFEDMIPFGEQVSAIYEFATTGKVENEVQAVLPPVWTALFGRGGRDQGIRGHLTDALIGGDDVDRGDSLGKALQSAIRQFVPTGTQLNRTFQGAQAISRGESMNDSGSTRFLVDNSSGWNIVKGLVAGQYATTEGQEWLRNGMNTIPKDVTIEYEGEKIPVSEFVRDYVQDPAIKAQYIGYYATKENAKKQLAKQDMSTSDVVKNIRTRLTAGYINQAQAALEIRKHNDLLVELYRPYMQENKNLPKYVTLDFTENVLLSEDVQPINYR